MLSETAIPTEVLRLTQDQNGPQADDVNQDAVRLAVNAKPHEQHETKKAKHNAIRHSSDQWGSRPPHVSGVQHRKQATTERSKERERRCKPSGTGRPTQPMSGDPCRDDCARRQTAT